MWQKQPPIPPPLWGPSAHFYSGGGGVVCKSEETPPPPVTSVHVHCLSLFRHWCGWGCRGGLGPDT